MTNQQIKKTHPKEIFNPVLFRDAADIDFEKHAGYIIARVLDYGDEKDLKSLRTIYKDEQLIGVIKKRRGIQPLTAKFWATYFKIPIEEIACLRMYYQKKQ